MIPVNEPSVGKKEIEYVKECLETGWISSEGKFIQKFESEFSKYCNRKHGIAVSNGTTALQVSVGCLDLKAGDEVIMPSFTIISCALAVLYNKGVPVLVDAAPDTWTMNVADVEKRITERTKAIMPVHIYGHPVDMGPLLELADRHKLKMVEDAAEAHGAEYKGKRCGGFGDLSCFSFYANKIITTGEGGMVLTDNDDLADKARSLRNLAFRKDRRFYHTELGHNFRMTNIQAAMGLAQLERIESLIAKKRWIGREYTKRLKNVKGIQLPVEEEWAKNVYWMYGIVLGEEIGFDASDFAKMLAEKGIATRPFFIGMHEQPVLLEMGLFRGEHYPVAERLTRKGLYLPSGMTLTEDQIEQVANAVKNLLPGN